MSRVTHLLSTLSKSVEESVFYTLPRVLPSGRRFQECFHVAGLLFPSWTFVNTPSWNDHGSEWHDGITHLLLLWKILENGRPAGAMPSTISGSGVEGSCTTPNFFIWSNFKCVFCII